MASMTVGPDLQQDHVGTLVRRWRERRRLSQQALSERCGVSTRHLSYIETGKSVPSPTMISQLGHALDVPLRAQRRMFTAAGFVPSASELPLDSPALAQVNEALELILAGHEPYPALVIDGGWDLVAANDAAYRLLHRPACRPRSSRRSTWCASRSIRAASRPGSRTSTSGAPAILGRIQHEHDVSGDPRLRALLADHPAPRHHAPPDIVLTVRFRVGDDVLSFLTTTTVFGTPRDVTVAELAIEALYPADAATRDQLLAAASADNASR